MVEFFHIIDFPFLLLEQAGLVFIIIWYVFILMAVAQSIFFIGNGFHNMWSGLKRNWLILFFTVIMFIMTILPVNTIELSDLVDRIYPPIIILHFSFLSSSPGW